jgi:hypothetical protein
MVGSAAAMGSIYAHIDATSLLTAFVSTSVECAKVGHQPSWFDPQALSNGTAAASSTGAGAGASAPAAASAPVALPVAPTTTPAAAPAAPATTFTAGTYEVGTDESQLPPGTYKATCASNGYWARLRSTSSTSDIIANDWKPNGGPMVVTVKKSDAAVELGNCSWTRSR